MDGRAAPWPLQQRPTEGNAVKEVHAVARDLVPSADTPRLQVLGEKRADAAKGQLAGCRLHDTGDNKALHDLVVLL